MPTVFIYCGVSGAGKSTLIANRHTKAFVVSTDKFFKDDYSDFDPAKLGAAHAWCLRKFVFALTGNPDSLLDVVVDNTNTSVAELAPYAALALAYGFDLKIITVECDPEIAHARNRHGVPLATVQAMADRLSKRDLPPWWPHEAINQANSIPVVQP